MIALLVGPSGSGKTILLKHWLLPTLLGPNPRSLSQLAPTRFKGALIDDPRSRNNPDGQYPGTRYRDVQAWRASPVKSRLSCFDSVQPRALCRLALELGDVVIGFDEIDMAITARAYYHDGNDGRPADPEWTLMQKGRHEGVFLFGGCRRLHNIHNNLRSNLQLAWFANLTEPEDRNYAADMVRVSRSSLSDIPRPVRPTDPRYFLEWRKETDQVYLVHLELEMDGATGAIINATRVAERMR